MTEDEAKLWNTYGTWTAMLNRWTALHLGRHIDVEFVPDQWVMRLYSGYAQERNMSWGITVPGIERPPHEAAFTMQLPRFEDHPSQADLDEAFRQLCLGAARVLEIDLGKPKLANSNNPSVAMEIKGVVTSRGAATKSKPIERAKKTKKPKNKSE